MNLHTFITRFGWMFAPLVAIAESHVRHDSRHFYLSRDAFALSLAPLETRNLYSLIHCIHLEKDAVNRDRSDHFSDHFYLTDCG